MENVIEYHLFECCLRQRQQVLTMRERCSQYRNMKKIEIWAHRGASGYIPENTMDAFEEAAIQHADGIELDVQMTKDKELVVFHDETLDRVTEATGYLKNFTLDQLQKLHVMTPGTRNGTYRIPTLAEVLDLLHSTGQVLNIELKNSVFPYFGMEEKVLDLVREHHMQDQVIYSSFNHFSVCRLKAMGSHIRTGLLFSDGLMGMAEYAKKAGVEAVHPAVYHYFYPGLIEECRDAGLKVHVWTVNEPEHLLMVKKAEADAVITNYPDRALRLLREDLEEIAGAGQTEAKETL